MENKRNAVSNKVDDAKQLNTIEAEWVVKTSLTLLNLTSFATTLQHEHTLPHQAELYGILLQPKVIIPSVGRSGYGAVISPDTTDTTLVFPMTTVAVAVNSDLLSLTSTSLNSIGPLPSIRIR